MGQIICIERPSRTPCPGSSSPGGGKGGGGVSELIFVGLFHFAAIKVLRSWNSRQIVPSRVDLSSWSSSAGARHTAPLPRHHPPRAVSPHYFRQPKVISILSLRLSYRRLWKDHSPNREAGGETISRNISIVDCPWNNVIQGHVTIEVCPFK